MSTDTHWRFASAPKTGEGAWLWFFKLVSGAVILVILGVHLVVNHFIGENGLLTYQDVVAYYQNIVIPVMEFVFLVFVVSHALVGVRSVILDLRPAPKALKALDRLFIVIGLAAIAWGSWLILAIASRG